MKKQKRLMAGVLLLTMLLSLMGGGLPRAAAVQPSVTVTTDRELAYDPLAPAARIAYEQHEEGYTVSLDRAEDSVTMNITAVPGGENSRAAEKAQLYIHTGVQLKAGTAYQISFSLFAENAQPEYAVCFDGGSAKAVYGTLEGRSIKAGGADQVKYQITPQAESGELVLRLLLGKTSETGNILRFSGLAVGEAPKNVVGRDAVLVEDLDYSAPGFIRYWTHTDRAAEVVCDGKSATLTVTNSPLKDAEVWKIKLFVATGLKPAPGKTYHFTATVDSTAKQGFELCYNEGETEKGYGAEYSQRLTGQGQTLDYLVRIPKDKENPGELIFQFSLGKLKTGDKVTLSDIRLEEAFPSYSDVLSDDFSFNDDNTSIGVIEPATRIKNAVNANPVVNWSGESSVTKNGDCAGDLTVTGGRATLEINGGQNLWDARFNIDTAANLKANTSYRVSFAVQAERDYAEYEVLYGTALNGVDNNQTYGSLKGLSLTAGETETIEYIINPETAGGLLISLQAGKTDGRYNAVTVSGFKIEEVAAGQPAGDNLASVRYPAEVDPSEVIDGVSYEAANSGGNASTAGIDGSAFKLDVTAIDSEPAPCKSKLYLKTGITPEKGKTYEVSFDIKGTDAQSDWEINYGKSADNKDYGAAYSGNLPAVSTGTAQTVTQTITAADSNGELWIILCLGKSVNTYWVSNVKVTEKGGTETPPDPPGPPEGSPGSFSVRADGAFGGSITGDGSSAVMICTGGDAGEGNAWKRGMFTGDICNLSAGNSYQVSFDIESTADTPFEVCYNKDSDWDAGEKGFGWQGGLTAASTSSSVTQTVTAGTGGKLRLRIDLGRAAEGTQVTVSNIQVRKIEQAPAGDSLASSVNYSGFSARDNKGTITASGNSATITCAAQESDPAAWQRGMFTGEICNLSAGNSYQVSFDITATAETHFDVCYNKDSDWGDGEGAFGHEYNLAAASESSTVKHTITPDADGKLLMRIDLGLAAENTQVTVSSIQVHKLEGTPAGGDLASVDYPDSGSGSQSESRIRKAGSYDRRMTGKENSAGERTVSLMRPDFSGSPAQLRKASRYTHTMTAGRNFASARAAINPGAFRVRAVDSYSGTITGDGTSATITCTGGDSGEMWKRGLFIDDICRLSTGTSYLVTFDITADAETPFEVCYNKDEDWGAGEKGFGAEYGLTANSGKSTVAHTVTPAADGSLRLRIDLGRAADNTGVTISNIQVRAIGYTTISAETIDCFGSVSAEGIEGYVTDLTKNSDSAVLKVTKPADDATGWKAKLFIRTGVAYDPNKAYRAQFDITAENAVKEFCVISQGVPDSEDIRGTWALTLGEGETKTVTTSPVPAGMGTGELVLQLELGNFEGTENTFTVSNVRVEEVELEISCEYDAELDFRGSTPSVLIRDTPPAAMMEFWKVKLFINTGVYAEKGETYRVSFDTWAFKDMDFEINYNRIPDEGDEEESGYGSVYGLHAARNQETTVEHIFTVSRDGVLRLQLMLGKAPDPNTVSVRNLRVERVTYTYARKSALPVEVEYKNPGAVSYWVHEDYSTAFTGTDSSITANITSAPAKGAEPWKIKLFLDTGKTLQAGKYYKVSANVSAKTAQDYEICYNNGGVEMGYDSLSGLRAEAGKTGTAEKIIAVPKDQTGLNHLTLQFNLGRTTAANAVTVSGIKVEEVSLSYTDMMPENFAYTEGGALSVWTNPDYSAALEGGDSKATLRITNVPAVGAEVWKTKLFIDTGAILSAGRTYLIRADLLAAKTQNYEVCFNNEETEKGFDALYNQTITAGQKTTVEKQITVPASMTDAGRLILQLSVGGAVTNDITVSGVSVQELNFGTGGGQPPADAVLNLRGASGTLDSASRKLTCQMPENTSGDRAVLMEGADLRAGDLYTVSFTAQASKNLSGTLSLRQAGGNSPVLSEPFQLITKERVYSFTTKDRLTEGGAYDLLWQFENGGADVEISNVTVTSPPETLEIVHGKQAIAVNGKTVTADSYNINGSNYVKLRDLALMLNDTDAQFVVRYNGKKQQISLTTGKPYTPVGGELSAGENRAASCVRSTLSVTVNGRTVNLKGYNIGRNNFYRLRDLNELLGFQVEYVAATNTASVTSPLTPEAQEKGHAYDLFFLPEIDGESQPYVGDTMPFYDNGVYYIYYLKDGGDAYNHSVYVATTKDFVHYTELDDPVLSASREDVQDNWIGTGSVVKVEDTYYFFYTGFNGSGSQEYREKIMVAKGSSPTSFEKVSGWEITPPAELGQKNDFRDPQAYYDPAGKTISLTVTASQDGKARILKLTLSKDLKNVKYDGIIFTDPTGEFWNLECSDTFRIGNKWYLTYSGQDDTLWYASADSRFGPYSNPARLEGKLFYAAKHVENEQNAYMVGWARRANSASSTQEVSGWAGNIAVQKLEQREDGSLALVPVDSILSAFDTPRPLNTSEASLTANSGYSYKEAFTSAESFLLKGEFTYSGTGSFGLAFDFNGKEEQYKLISIDPKSNRLRLSFNKGATTITETQAALQPNQKHSFTYIQDGSVGIIYVDDQAALTVRLYGVTDKPIYLFAENNSVTFTALQQYTQSSQRD